MTLTNKTLITLIQSINDETKVATLLQAKLDDDQARRDYHKKYNAKKNATLKIVREQHPEIFAAAKAAVA